MARYQADPERRRVAALIDEEVARARATEAEGGWITYLIRDPRFPDKLGNPAGTPIYVGQSIAFGKCVRSCSINAKRRPLRRTASSAVWRALAIAHGVPKQGRVGALRNPTTPEHHFRLPEIDIQTAEGTSRSNDTNDTH
jgi:hypothetical protein